MAVSRRLFVAAASCGCLVPSAAFTQPATGKYVCPPCGCDLDGKVFDAPGSCPAPGCGMTLVPQPKEPAPAPQPPS
jgi:hypothetical protein